MLLLLRQTLPLLAVINGRGLVHGDVNPRNLLRRHSDGLPVLLDFGLVQICGEAPLAGATPGYAPRAQGRSEPCAAWMDLHGLGVTALVLLSGRTPESLIAADGGGWSWPDQLELEPEFRAVLERLLLEAPDRRFAEAAQVLAALEPLALPLGHRVLAVRLSFQSPCSSANLRPSIFSSMFLSAILASAPLSASCSAPYATSLRALGPSSSIQCDP